MTREEAKKEIEKVFEPAFANYIIEALTKGATVSDRKSTEMTREEAIKILNTLLFFEKVDCTKEEAKECVKMAIKALEQEPKRGHWIDINCHHYYNDGDIETTELRCSCCNEEVEWDIELLHKPYFCENCGADMREVEE